MSDGMIDVSEVHGSHIPEGPDNYLMSGLCWCMRCCKLVATQVLGARPIGRRPCAGPVPMRPFEPMTDPGAVDG